MEYRACVEELLFSSQVQHMKSIRHHPGVSCYEHSVFVSYVAWYLADRWGADARTAARAGLLHDLWPLSRRAPRSREAAAVCLADKLCATAEIMQIWRNLGLRRAVLSGA